MSGQNKISQLNPFWNGITAYADTNNKQISFAHDETFGQWIVFDARIRKGIQRTAAAAFEMNIVRLLFIIKKIFMHPIGIL